MSAFSRRRMPDKVAPVPVPRLAAVVVGFIIVVLPLAAR